MEEGFSTVKSYKIFIHRCVNRLSMFVAMIDEFFPGKVVWIA